MTWDKITEKEGALKPLHGVLTAVDVSLSGSEQYFAFFFAQAAHGLLLTLTHFMQNALRRSATCVGEADGFVPAVFRKLFKPHPAFFIKGRNDRVDRLLGEQAARAQLFLRALFSAVNGAENGKACERQPDGLGVFFVRGVPFLQICAILVNLLLNIGLHRVTPFTSKY